MVINREEFINRMAKKGKVSKRSCKKYMDMMFSTFYGLLQEGDVIKFHSLFSAEVKVTPDKPARNMKTGERCIVPEHKYLKFKISKSVNHRLNS